MNTEKFKQLIVLLTFSILFTSCNKQSNLEYEKEVLYEIFPTLLDSVWVHGQVPIMLTLPKFDKNNKFIGFEKLTDKEKLKRNGHKTITDSNC